MILSGSFTWSAIDTEQAIARVHRIGSEIHESVEIVDYLTPGTVEVGQLARLEAKADALEDVVHDAARLDDLLKGRLT